MVPVQILQSASIHLPFTTTPHPHRIGQGVMMAIGKFCRRHRRRPRLKSNPNHQIDIFSGVYLMNDCCALCTGVVWCRYVSRCPVSLGSSQDPDGCSPASSVEVGGCTCGERGKTCCPSVIVTNQKVMNEHCLGCVCVWVCRFLYRTNRDSMEYMDESCQPCTAHDRRRIVGKTGPDVWLIRI